MQETQSAHAASSSQLKAALAEVDSLRAELGDANSGVQQSERTAQHAVALTQQLAEVTHSHDAMMQSRDRAMAQVEAPLTTMCNLGC